jgi:hypothetical protein
MDSSGARAGRRRDQSRSYGFADEEELDEDGMPINLRTIGRSESFKAD